MPMTLHVTGIAEAFMDLSLVNPSTTYKGACFGWAMHGRSDQIGPRFRVRQIRGTAKARRYSLCSAVPSLKPIYLRHLTQLFSATIGQKKRDPADVTYAGLPFLESLGKA